MSEADASYATTIDSLQDALRRQGAQQGVTPWQLLTQAQVDAFARTTGDMQWIHIDPARAAGGPFGGCIAHGLLTLSLAGGAFFHQLIRTSAKHGVNYGCDRVRYPAPVRVGAKIRGRANIQKSEPIDDNGVQMVVRVTVDIEGERRPGCVADFVVRYYF